MHELGLTQQIVEIVSDAAGGSRVTKVVLQIGRLSCVLPDAVRFCFDLCTQGTVAEGATLEILQTPGVAECERCGRRIESDQLLVQCPCGSTDVRWLSGEELKITQMEVL